LYVEGRQTNAINRDGIAVLCVAGNRVRFDHDACVLTVLLDGSDATKFFNDPCEHDFSAPNPDTAIRDLHTPASAYGSMLVSELGAGPR
jgi:hypothetical protein